MSYLKKKNNYSLVSVVQAFHSIRKGTILHRTSLRVPLKGSLTLEAALIFPFIICFIALLLSFFQLEWFHAGINQSLIETGNEITASITSGNSQLLTQAEASALLMERMKKRGLSLGSLEHKQLTIQTAESDEEYLRIKLSYRLMLPVTLYRVQGPKQTLSMTFRYWTQGTQQDENKDEAWVYITETGTVYHKTTSCYHLKLSIQQILMSQVQDARNQGGAKYYPCELCGNKEQTESVYITKEGNRYHTSLSCSGLKRTVLHVKLSELTGYAPCSNCWKGE